MTRPVAAAIALLAAALLSGCSKDAPSPAGSVSQPAGSPLSADVGVGSGPVAKAPEDPGRGVEDRAATSRSAATGIPTPEELQAAIREKNKAFQGEVFLQMDERGLVVGISDPAVEDISPLKGLPLSAVDLHDCRITSIRDLEGMALTMIDLSNTGVSDVGVLKGMPLTKAYFENTRLRNISALSGAPLEELYLSQTPVEDISALAGAPLVNLNLVDTRVVDLKPLAGGRLQSVWLNNTPVKDCTPLASNPLVSLTLAGTKISDISPLKGHPTLQRLHIAETEVTDLTPLQWMNGLTRLIFTPNRIEKGMEYARRMPSLREIGVAFGTSDRPEQMFPPQVFWEMYDAGRFN